METLKLPSQNSTQDPQLLPEPMCALGRLPGAHSPSSTSRGRTLAGPRGWGGDPRYFCQGWPLPRGLQLPPLPSQLREGSCLECLWQSSQARGGMTMALHPGMSAERAPFSGGGREGNWSEAHKAQSPQGSHLPPTSGSSCPPRFAGTPPSSRNQT